MLFIVARGFTACLKTYLKHLTSTSSSVGFKNSFSLKYLRFVFSVILLSYLKSANGNRNKRCSLNVIVSKLQIVTDNCNLNHCFYLQNDSDKYLILQFIDWLIVKGFPGSEMALAINISQVNIMNPLAISNSLRLTLQNKNLSKTL